MPRSTIISIAPRVRLAFALFLLILLVIALFSCDNTRNADSPIRHTFITEKEQERAILTKELRNLEKKIDRELERVRKHIVHVDKEDRSQLFHTDRKLQSNKSKVGKALRDVEYSSETNWETTKTIAQETIRDIKSSSDELAFQFNALLKED